MLIICYNLNNRKLPRTIETFNNIKYLNGKLSPGEFLEILSKSKPDALIVEELPEGVRLRDLVAYGGENLIIAHLKNATPLNDTFDSSSIFHVKDEFEALQKIERLYASRQISGGLRHSVGTRNITLIGAGVVNLITAIRVLGPGKRISIVEKSPSPSSLDWSSYGCTNGGDDARMFTLTEMDNYNAKGLDKLSDPIFTRPITEGGWGIYRSPLTQPENDWVEEFNNIPGWLARNYNEDIFKLNAAALDDWQALRNDIPELFEDVNLRDGILRLYSDENAYNSAIERQNNVGATLRKLTKNDLKHDYPTIAGAVDAGKIVGGVLVKGFTLNIHKFVRNIIKYLERNGVSFFWNTTIDQLLRNSNGKIIGATTRNGIIFQNQLFIVSVGAYGNELLKNTPCHNKIHGVLGGWVRIENAEPLLTNSMKITRNGHITEDANVTVAKSSEGQPILILGSGYGYTGLSPDNIEPELLDRMKLGVLDTATKLFPENPVQSSYAMGTTNSDFKYCVRPWTSTSLGIYYSEVGAEGSELIITGGHNTGGFAQATCVASAVLASIHGYTHPMHWAFNPERLENFRYLKKDGHPQFASLPDSGQTKQSA